MNTNLLDLRLEAAVKEWTRFRGTTEHIKNERCDVCLNKKGQLIRRGFKTVCLDYSQLPDLKPLIHATRPLNFQDLLD